MSSRRPALALAAATLTGLLAAGAPAGAHAPARQAAATPRLALASLSPPAVKGSAFVSGERVTLTLKGLPGGTRVRHRRASDAGTFTAVFAKAKAGHCGGFTIRARGDAGSRAMVRRFQLPGCSAG
jgi:hypothetical protein